MDYSLSTLKELIPYSGTYTDIAAWKIAKSLSAGGDYCFISDYPAGILINNTKFNEALVNVIGGSQPEDIRNIIINGEDGGKSKYSINNNLSLNDFVSENVMKYTKSSNVNPFIFETDTTKVFFRTEIDAILENSNIKTIWGIDKIEFTHMLNNYSKYGYSSRNDALVGISDIFKLKTLNELDNVKITYSTNVNGDIYISSVNTSEIGGGKSEFSTNFPEIKVNGTKTVGETVFGFESDAKFAEKYPKLADMFKSKPEYKIYAKLLAAWEEHPEKRSAISSYISNFSTNYEKFSEMLTI